jgi:hypothetical protein
MISTPYPTLLELSDQRYVICIEEKRNAYKILAGNPEEKRPHGRL